MIKSHSHRVCRILAALGTVLLIIGCVDKGPQYDSSKQVAFMSQFAPGMTIEDVETILAPLEGIVLDGMYDDFADGGITYQYSTSLELYGSHRFSFLYSSDLELLWVVPAEPPY